MSVAAQRLQQALLPELFVCFILRFGQPIAIQGKEVARGHVDFIDRTIEAF